jgi:tetratricopeptide (TPR) repeat protein
MKKLLVSIAALLLMSLTACSPSAPPEPPKPAEIPITSKSPQAVDQFKKGRDLAENLRMAEATQALDEALKLDPDFAQAHAYRGIATTGPAGLKEIERAAELSASLPPAEKVLIDATLAARRGEAAKSIELWKQLTVLVPADSRSWASLGGQLYAGQKYGEAADALQKATGLNPKAGPAFNMLGYAHLVQGEAGPAIDALKQYASVNPEEPNPQDSLGEALMAGGQFAESEAAFRKAIALSPSFHVAWEGIAFDKAFQGDWAGANEALKHAAESAPRSSDKYEVESLAAAFSMAAGKSAEGMKQLDGLEKSPNASVVDIAFVPISRAAALIKAARYPDAQAQLAKALQTADAGTLPPGPTRSLRRNALTLRSAIEGKSGNAAAAEKTAAALQQDATARPDDAQLQSAVHFSQGMLAAAKKDLKAARMHFDLCSTQDDYCHWQAFLVAQKGGDHEGADAARARLVKVYVRDPVYLMVRSSLNRMKPKG